MEKKIINEVASEIISSPSITIYRGNEEKARNIVKLALTRFLNRVDNHREAQQRLWLDEKVNTKKSADEIIESFRNQIRGK